MSDFLNTPCTAFLGMRQLARGALIDVALAVKAAEANGADILTFDDASGAVIDLDLRGGTAEIVGRLNERAKLAVAEKRRKSEGEDSAPRPRGRPKLGVVAREVTLLPRHWEWLAAQPGGASQALRRLVELARRADGGQTEARARRERAYRFMSAIAGDLPGFEEAARALFADDGAALADRIAGWPPDVSRHVLRLLGSNG